MRSEYRGPFVEDVRRQPQSQPANSASGARIRDLSNSLVSHVSKQRVCTAGTHHWQTTRPIQESKHTPKETFRHVRPVIPMRDVRAKVERPI